MSKSKYTKEFKLKVLKEHEGFLEAFGEVSQPNSMEKIWEEEGGRGWKWGRGCDRMGEEGEQKMFLQGQIFYIDYFI